MCVLTNLDLELEFSTRNPLSVMTRCRAANWSWKNFVKASLQEFSDRKKVN